MSEPSPHLPAFSVRPHLSHPSEPISIWFTEPLGLLTQITRPATGSVEMARFVIDLAWPALLEVRGSGREPLHMVHELSLLEDMDPEAGRLMTMFGLSARRNIARIVVVEPPTLPRIVHHAINAVGTAMGLIGIPMELMPTLREVVDRYGYRAREA